MHEGENGPAVVLAQMLEGWHGRLHVLEWRHLAALADAPEQIAVALTRGGVEMVGQVRGLVRQTGGHRAVALAALAMTTGTLLLVELLAARRDHLVVPLVPFHAGVFRRGAHPAVVTVTAACVVPAPAMGVPVTVSPCVVAAGEGRRCEQESTADTDEFESFHTESFLCRWRPRYPGAAGLPQNQMRMPATICTSSVFSPAAFLRSAVWP